MQQDLGRKLIKLYKQLTVPLQGPNLSLKIQPIIQLFELKY